LKFVVVCCFLTRTNSKKAGAMRAISRALAILLATAPLAQSLVPQRPSSAFQVRTALSVATSPKKTETVEAVEEAPNKQKLVCDVPPFNNVMAANRAEIAVRIMRAATELNCGTVAIYGHEDRYSQHRWGADKSFLLTKKDEASPISAYLDVEQIIEIAKEAHVDAIHPGYGFLSESPQFAQACAEAGITFVGPTVENLNMFSDKTSARTAATAAGVPVVPGSDGPLTSAEDVTKFVEEIGLPVIIKVNYYCACHFISAYAQRSHASCYRLQWVGVERACVL
jgi:pyruvate carboxylase